MHECMTQVEKRIFVISVMDFKPHMLLWVAVTKMLDILKLMTFEKL